MLFAHKIIAALRDPKSSMWATDTNSHNNIVPRVNKEVNKFLIEHLPQAEMFDFGDLHLEPTMEKEGQHKVPSLTPDEREFWREGLIPLPHRIVWYEFVLNGWRSGYLLVEKGTTLRGTRIDLIKDDCFSDGMIVQVDRDDPGPDWTFAYWGNQEMFGHIKKDPLFGITFYGMNMMLSIYLTLMLNSKTTELRTEVAPEKLNRARIKRGAIPLLPHRVVTIVPKRFVDQSRERASGTGVSPRLHWRRSHKRHFERQTPTAKWMAIEDHNGRLGWWVSVIPRHLVGKAEIGTVSHEYRVHIN
jgi:hypothetical protein